MLDRIQEAIERIKADGGRKVLLQLPDGLKPDVFDIFTRFSREFNVVVSSEAFYGACDVGSFETYSKVDYIVQFGHSIIPNIKYPKQMIFIEYPYDTRINVSDDQLDTLRSHNIKTMGVLFSVQYRDQAMQLKTILENSGFKVPVGRQDARLKYPGQVLGCNFSSAHSMSMEADAFVVVSTGMFHAIGVQLATDREVFIFDINSMSMRSVKDDVDRFLRKRYARISRAPSAKKLCIVVDTKIGQYRNRIADVIADQATSIGLKTIRLEANDLRPSDLENMRCDAVVFTGCPRVPIDDAEKFRMPILTPPEFQQMFGFKKTKRYIMDEIVSVDDLRSA